MPVEDYLSVRATHTDVCDAHVLVITSAQFILGDACIVLWGQQVDELGRRFID